jgi:hypothetical protein
MIHEITKQRRRADEPVQISDSCFPTLPVGVEYWTVTLAGWPFTVLTLAIKRVALSGNMTL